MPRDIPLSRYRNIGIVAHVDAGKTTCTERILYCTGRLRRVGEVHHGNAQLDWMPEEQRRGITITAAATTTLWVPIVGAEASHEHRVTILDTPGHVDFTIEVERSLRVLDGAVVVLDGGNGVEPQSETVWRQADRHGVPRIVFVNKVDKPGADFDACVRSLRERLGANAVAVQRPVGEGPAFTGLLDLVHDRRIAFEGEDSHRYQSHEIPDALRAEAAAAREALVAACGEFDESIMTTYAQFGPQAVTPQALEQALRRGTIARAITPVLAGSAIKNKGVAPLLDAVAAYLPSPADLPDVLGRRPGSGADVRLAADPAAPLCALVFKLASDPDVGHITYLRVYAGTLRAGATVFNATLGRHERFGRLMVMHANQRERIDQATAGMIVAAVGPRASRTGDTLCDQDAPVSLASLVVPEPVVRVALVPKGTADLDRLAAGLRKLCDEDPTLRTSVDEETGHTCLTGMGELHLEVVVERLRSEHRVEVGVGRPSVSYRETVGGHGVVDYKHVKQNGGQGQYARVRLAVETGPRGSGVEFVDETTGGSVPRAFVPAIEKGVRAAAERGVLAGYPVVDVRARLLDGDAHVKDSSALAFETAARAAFAEAAQAAGPKLLEPVMALEIVTPESFVGDVIGDLNARRGQITGLGERAGARVIEAFVPLRSLFGYVTDLRGKTQGRASASMSFDHYAEAPPGVGRVE